jgi:hypothetical protein
MEGQEDAVREMLQRFARAFTTGDGPGAAACWEVPALVVSGEGNRAVAKLEEVAAFFGGAKTQYNEQGIHGTRADVECFEWHAPQLASVTVRWPYLDAQGGEVGGAERSVYLVRVKDGQARIFAVMMLGTERGA